jgi:hypothetical protein
MRKVGGLMLGINVIVGLWAVVGLLVRLRMGGSGSEGHVYDVAEEGDRFRDDSAVDEEAQEGQERRLIEEQDAEELGEEGNGLVIQASRLRD